MTQEEVMSKLFESFEKQSSQLEKRAKWSEYKFWGILGTLVLYFSYQFIFGTEVSFDQNSVTENSGMVEQSIMK